ncbi:hypothetical protein ACFX13_016964 [Malus domestica]
MKDHSPPNHYGQTTAVPTSPSNPPKMDARIWSKLPEELLDLVLSFLPLKNFLILRSTCKRIKSLLFSPSFVFKHSSAFLLLSHPQCFRHFPLYDSDTTTWRKLPLSLSAPLPCAAGAAAQASLLCASNGLLCFSLPNSFLVFNILTKSSRVIKFPDCPSGFELFSLISTPAGYNLFMASSRSSSKSTFVYHSKARSWQKFDFTETILSDNCHQKGVYFKGCLYFVTPEPFSIVCFEFESGKWERPIPELPTELVFARLVSGGGEKKLYLIGGVGRNGIARSLQVWELEFGGGMKWVEVESLPDRMCKKLMSVCFHNYEHLYCFWHQGLICVCCYNWPEILYFKISRRTWHWIPKCPSLPDKSSCGFRWFSFVPNFHSSA